MLGFLRGYGLSAGCREGEQLYVSFPPQRSKNARAALGALCTYLNAYCNIDLDLSFIKIGFSVEEKS